MTVYTTYWNKVARNNTDGYLIVQVSNSRPAYIQKTPILELSTMYPSWKLVSDLKKGTITPLQYSEMYAAEITARDLAIAREQLQEGLRVMGTDKALFTCYEGPGKFCHRYACARMIAGADCTEW